MALEPPPIITLIEELLGWCLDRTAGFPKSQRFTFGQRIDMLAIEALERAVAARFSPAKERCRELTTLNLVLEKLRVFWRIVEARGWITTRQLLFVAAKLDEVGRMAGGWMKASATRSP
jgi:hypothetical protein